jgi:magnesium transporter
VGILFAPTLIGTVYGMNFDYMTELYRIFGYPFALLLMALVCSSCTGCSAAATGLTQE